MEGIVMALWSGTGFASFAKRLKPKIQRAQAEQGGNYYGDPQFVEQERLLRQRVGGDIGQMTQGLVARGYSPEHAKRKLMRATIGAQGQFRQLGAAQADVIRQRHEAARERRRQRRGGILGTLVSAGTQFGGLGFGSYLKRREIAAAEKAGLTGYGG
jgi:hypothetical protein